MEKVKILAIDNSADHIVVLEALLTGAFPNMQFFCAPAGKAGIELCLSEKPDVILLDIGLPGMNGNEVCKILKTNESTRSIPIVMMTDVLTDKESRKKALESGADAFLTKPLDESEMTAQIRVMLRVKELEDRKLDEKERIAALVVERTRQLETELNESKRIEKALQESEEKYRSMVDLLPDAVIIHEGGKIVFANAASLKTVGADSLDQLAEKPLMEMVHPDYRTMALDRIKKIISTGKPSNFSEEKFITLKNEVIDVEVIGIPIRYRGKPAIQTIVRDITERKRMDEALKKSLSLMEATLESIHNGILVVSPTGTVIKTSARFAEMWHIPEDILATGDDRTLINNILEQLSNPDGFIATVSELYEKPDAETIDLIYFKDGRIFERISKPMYLEGEPKGRVWSFLDITKRMQAEEALREREQLFQGLFNASPDAIVLIDPHHPIVSWPIVDCNEASCQMNGYTREELIGQSIDLLNTTDGTPEERIAYIKKLRQKGIIHMETTHRHKDGHFFPVEVSTSIVTLGGHELVLGIDRDITERKQANVELQKSYDMLNKLTAQVPGVVYQYRLYPDGTSVFPYSSPGMFDIYEVPSEEVREDASTVFTRIHPDDYNSIVETITESARSLTLYHSEFRVILPKQGLRWRMCDAKPERLEDGSTLWYGIITDITDRKQTEIALKESEDRYRGFISQVSEGVYRFECDQPVDITLPEEEQIDLIYDHFFIAECNKAILKMYKLSDEKEMIGKGPLDFHGGRNNPVNRETFRTFIRNGYRVENAITEEVNIAGQSMYISNNSLGIVEDNRLVRMWGTQTDVTEKMKADQVQQVIFAISNAALSSKDLKELLEIISGQLGKLLDSTNFYIAFYDETNGMLSTHFEKDQMDQFECWPAEKSITGYVISHNQSLLAKDTDVVALCETGEIEMIGTPSKVWLGVPLSVDQKVIGAIVVQSYDNPNAYTEKDKQMLEFVSSQISISIERKKAEQELREALVRARESDRLKSAFLANVSHEIRTPLNSILGFSDLMLDPEFEIDQQHDFAGMINASGNNLLVIINDIMDISKIEAGLVKLNKSIFSVQKLIGDIQKEYSFKALHKGIELRLDPSNPEKEIFIASDESKLRQILINFVGNSIKFTEKGFVEIGIWIKGNSVQFMIKDSGIGIPEEFHGQIFERFRQVESAESKRYGGTGLGLAIAKSLIELLGGEIGLESEKGQGSIFYFSLPL